MKRVFVCSPYSGNTEKNIRIAREYCRVLAEKGFSPYAPHLYMPDAMGDKADSDKRKRNLGIECGLAWLNAADFIVVAATGYRDVAITEGMRREIDHARDRLKLPVIWQPSPEDLEAVLTAAMRVRKLYMPRGRKRDALASCQGAKRAEVEAVIDYLDSVGLTK